MNNAPCKALPPVIEHYRDLGPANETVPLEYRRVGPDGTAPCDYPARFIRLALCAALDGIDHWSKGK